MTERTRAEDILQLDASTELSVVGGKGASLARLARAGLPVPDGFHITTAAYRTFVEENDLEERITSAIQTVDPDAPSSLESASAAIREAFLRATIPADIADEIEHAYRALQGSNPRVVVRSSATAEDLPQASFAGQLESFLNVGDLEGLLEAVRKCWASLWTARAIAYRAERSQGTMDVQMAVVVQILVPAQASGVTFTANPLTGQRDEMMINASWGLGEAVVGGAVTPDSILASKNTGEVLSHKVADKEIMTVTVPGGTEEREVPEDQRHRPVLNDEQVNRLVELGSDIEDLYGQPMDVEWALADGNIWIVQARPITALPKATASQPIEWELPEGAYVAMRNNIVELMADPLSPLFATLGLSSVNRSMRRLLADFLGREGIMPEEIIISVNHYAYYNGSIRFAPMVRLLLDSVGIARRMFTGVVERWEDEGRPQYLEKIAGWRSLDQEEADSQKLLEGARELTQAAVAAYGSLVSGVIPAAWISEAVFTFAYRALIRRGEDPPAHVFLLGFESTPIETEKSIYDLAQWIAASPDLEGFILDRPTRSLAAAIGMGEIPTGAPGEMWREWTRRFQEHLEQYGHMIYNLDFANPVPADDPTPTLGTLKMFLREEGRDPYARQREAIERRERAVAQVERRLGRLRLRLFRSTLETAQRFAPMRENGIADVGLAYPIIRQMLLKLGSRLSAAGCIQEAADVFWLREEEVVDAGIKLDLGQSVDDLSHEVERRKRSWDKAKRLSPPRMLPHKILGIEFGRLMPFRGRGLVLSGVAASPGQVVAPARVLTSPADFDRMNTGDVLVASITTPAWTPLFARASAIVTDIGGPLSHGSIVAREYGIPAVLGTGSATSRIQDGDRITVNGSEGKVYLDVGRPSR